MRHGFMPDYLPSTVVVDAERRHRLTAAEREGTPVRRRRQRNVWSRVRTWAGRHRPTIRATPEPETATPPRFRLDH